MNLDECKNQEGILIDLEVAQSGWKDCSVLNSFSNFQIQFKSPLSHALKPK